MSEAKFTRGPWETSYREDKDGMFNQDVYDSAGESICTCSWYAVDNGITEVSGKAYRSTTTNREHNADLIAAAPDMYDMLHSIENDSNQVPPFLWDKIQAVLAKARGEHV